MSERYYLFRGDELIFTANTDMGAGDSHAHGQAGDVLICVRRDSLRGWYWNNNEPVKPNSQLPWEDIPHLDPKYRVLVMLQT